MLWSLSLPNLPPPSTQGGIPTVEQAIATLEWAQQSHQNGLDRDEYEHYRFSEGEPWTPEKWRQWDQKWVLDYQGVIDLLEERR